MGRRARAVETLQPAGRAVTSASEQGPDRDLLRHTSPSRVRCVSTTAGRRGPREISRSWTRSAGPCGGTARSDGGDHVRAGRASWYRGRSLRDSVPRSVPPTLSSTRYIVVGQSHTHVLDPGISRHDPRSTEHHLTHGATRGRPRRGTVHAAVDAAPTTRGRPSAHCEIRSEPRVTGRTGRRRPRRAAGSRSAHRPSGRHRAGRRGRSGARRKRFAVFVLPTDREDGAGPPGCTSRWR